MPKTEADVSPEHFEWLVDGRSRNQKSTLDIYRALKDNEDKLNKNVEIENAAQELTGIAFSLWRAVFLSDTTEEFEDQYADAKKFLVSLISDNTVLYITDKNARNWSFRYYLDNATFRLSRLIAKDPKLLTREAISQMADSDKDEWINAQSALEEAVRNFQAAVSAVA